jgi:chromosome partitioning protein
MPHAPDERPLPVRSVVVGHEAEQSGSTTLCLHIAAALLAQGQQVATVELDTAERRLTRAIAQRRATIARDGLDFALPTHFDITAALAGGEALASLADTIAEIEARHDFVILDASRAEDAVRRIVYSFADTLVMPFTLPQLDLALDAAADPDIFAAGGFRDIAWKVREARRERRVLDSGRIDWVILRNRLPLCQAELGVPARIAELTGRAAMEYGFRTLEGLSERAVYRDALASGLTLFDRDTELLPLTVPGALTMSAPLEAWTLIEGLNLPINLAARRRAVALAQTAAAARRPLALDELLAP